MSDALDAILAFARDEDGATMAEYALLAALIAVAAIIGAKALGIGIGGKLGSTAHIVNSGGA